MIISQIFLFGLVSSRTFVEEMNAIFDETMHLVVIRVILVEFGNFLSRRLVRFRRQDFSGSQEGDIC